MSKKKEIEKPYTIEKVETLPPSKKARVTFYDDIVNEILQRDKGFYKISVKDRHVNARALGRLKFLMLMFLYIRTLNIQRGQQ
jgi:hypothetical protein